MDSSGLPIVIAGSSTALVRRILENSAWQSTGGVFRKLAGVVIICLGVYFIASLFLQEHKRRSVCTGKK